MNRPQVTREDVRRIIREYMISHPIEGEGDLSDGLDEFAEKRNFDPKVWGDVIEAAANSGSIFFTLMMMKQAEGLPEDTLVPVDVEEMVGDVCGAVAATFFMLGFEVARETG